MEGTKIFLSFACVSLMCATGLASVTWSTWTECTQTCGYGVEMRHRACPRGDHADCSVDELGQLRRCKLRECPIDGGWVTWSRWRPCSKTCGEGGTRVRYRACTNPRPRYGGIPCQGSRRETKSCRPLPPCPVDGGWSNWMEWGDCSARFCRKRGFRYRSRSCTNPAPLHGGTPCDGAGSESEKCSKPNCKDVIEEESVSSVSSVAEPCWDDSFGSSEGDPIGTTDFTAITADLHWSSSNSDDESSFDGAETNPEEAGELNWSSASSNSDGESSFEGAETTPKISPHHVTTPPNEGEECNHGSSESSFC